jgi:hypothetical protein
LSAETVRLLHRDGEAIRRHMITAVVPFDEAPTLLEDLSARRRQEVQAVLEFPT